MDFDARKMSMPRSYRRKISMLAPGRRIHLLLQDVTEEQEEEIVEFHPIFTEMLEMQESGEWRETARWVKFEETVEDGGDRWSKPHVATLSLHSLFELRSHLMNGTVVLDAEAGDMDSIVDKILQKPGAIEKNCHEKFRQLLLRNYRHQYENRHDSTGNKKHGNKGTPREDSTKKGNAAFMRKIPADIEAAVVLCAGVDFVQKPTPCFVRLSIAQQLPEVTEVPIDTRFLFILLGPVAQLEQLRQICRSIGTLMVDEIFHDVCYRARNRRDLLDGVDEFLDQVTVLPPGEWDPNIRIEPPPTIPSQLKRRQETNDEEKQEEGEGHGDDPALKRTGRLMGGLFADIRRKKPWYLSDFKDALNMQCIATLFFMYFALLAPIVTFGGLLEEATGKNMAAMENLFAGAICGITYHLFSGQPLTIIGSTGPVLVFETIIYDVCKGLDINYLSFRFWVNAWTAVILLLMVFTDASALVAYITRFTEESFATLIALIFIYSAILKAFKILKTDYTVVEWNPDELNASCDCLGTDADPSAKWFNKAVSKYKYNLSSVPWYMGSANNGTTYLIDYGMIPLDECERLHGHLDGTGCYVMYDVFLMSFVLLVGTFILAMGLKSMRNSCYFPNKVRQMLSDFAVMIAIIVMVGIDLLFKIDTPKLNVPSTFRPTLDGREWLISPFGKNKDGVTNPMWTVPLAVVPALLACILIFMDQQITAVIVNRKENKLKKGCGYHLDLFVLALLIFVVGFLGIPIYVAATVLSINHVNSLRMVSESRAPGEQAAFTGVREQRLTGMVTFLLIGLSVLLTGVLQYIPMPVLYGVFLYMGIAALGGIQLFDRLLLLLMPMKYQPDYAYLRHVPIKRVHLFTAFQVACLVVLWVIKSVKSISIAFPIMLVVMVGVRKLMERVFTEDELQHLDDHMPEFILRKREDAEFQETFFDKDDSTLNVPMTSGNVMKISVASADPATRRKLTLNLSEEMNKSGLWKFIDAKTMEPTWTPESARLPLLEEGEE